MVYDGQSRVDGAANIGIPIWYVVDPEAAKWSPAHFNGYDAQSSWSLRNYVDVYAQDDPEYQALKAFSEEYQLPLSSSASLLQTGIHTAGAIPTIKDGHFAVNNAAFAAKVGSLVVQIRPLLKASRLTNNSGLQAVINLAHLPKTVFDPQRLIKKLKVFPTQIKPCRSTAEFLAMFEHLYNYKTYAENEVALAFEALKAAKRRSRKNLKSTKEGDE
jgi:hypothetical protein